jgi:hypothetical protein
MAGMKLTEHTLLRDSFALTLKLDEATGQFVCTCKPPPNIVINADVRRESTLWFKLIANGWARRRNNGVHVDRNAVRIHCGGFKNGTMRGTIIAPEMTAQDIAAANTRAQLVAKLKRGEKLVGNEVTLAIGFGLGEPYRNARNEVCLKPYNYRTSNWGTWRLQRRKTTAATTT